MNIPPFLEKLLLSNEAVFKNAALGLSGQNMVYVPPGKTAVILEINIQPFCNINRNATLIETLIREGALSSNSQDFMSSLQEKMAFQLQVINDNYNTNFSFANAFSFNGSNLSGASSHRFINYQFSGWKEDVFIYTDRSLYFNFVYPYFNDGVDFYTGLIYTYGTPQFDFSPKIQPLPETPITFNQGQNINFVIGMLTNSTSDAYFPTNKQVADTTIGFDSPQTEYLRFNPFNDITDAEENSIVLNQPTGSPMAFWELATLPLLNIKYALLNKRPSDYGITKPGI